MKNITKNPVKKNKICTKKHYKKFDENKIRTKKITKVNLFYYKKFSQTLQK